MISISCEKEKELQISYEFEIGAQSKLIEARNNSCTIFCNCNSSKPRLYSRMVKDRVFLCRYPNDKDSHSHSCRFSKAYPKLKKHETKIIVDYSLEVMNFLKSQQQPFSNADSALKTIHVHMLKKHSSVTIPVDSDVTKECFIDANHNVVRLFSLVNNIKTSKSGAIYVYAKNVYFPILFVDPKMREQVLSYYSEAKKASSALFISVSVSKHKDNSYLYPLATSLFFRRGE